MPDQLDSNLSAEWLNLADVIMALQTSIHAANQSMRDASQSQGQGVHYVINELNIALAAHVVTENDVAKLRFPPNFMDPTASVPDASLSRVTLNLRPVPILDDGTSTPPQPAPWISVSAPGPLDVRAITRQKDPQGLMFAVGDKGLLLLSKNQGQMWEPIEPPAGATLHALWGGVPGNPFSYAAGDGGTIRRAPWGSTAWEYLQGNTGDSLRGIHGSADGKVVVVVGDNGAVRFSFDRGNSWFVGDTGTNLRLYAVGGLGTPYLYAVGEQGMIFRSKDLGKSWEAVDSGTGETLHGVWESDNHVVHAVGAAGTILMSKDNGASWLPLPSGTDEDLHAIRGRLPGALYAVGTGGTLLRSTDGETWSALQSGTTNELLAIAGDGGAPYCVAGAQGTILRGG
ncbi:MAG: hypothetical protein QM820_16710 [Minicystis sp.]